MSDSDSILGQVGDSLKDLGKDVVKQITGTPTEVVKTITQQTTGKTDSPETVAKKQQLAHQETARLAQIEAEMTQIAKQREQLTGPEIKKSETSEDGSLSQETDKPVDISLQRAKTRMESDKANKG
jgi:hypothetical protein